MGHPANYCDITGQRFGSWTAVKRVESPEENRWRAYWEFECDCGAKKIARADDLKRKNVLPYCSKCRKQNRIIDIRDLDHETAELVRQRTNQVFTKTIVTDGDVAVGYTADGYAYLIDAEDVGKVAHYTWIVKGRGYVTSKVKSTERYLHNYILSNYDTGYNVDHRNQDKLDNRKANFRISSSQQNAFNKGKPKSNTSGVKGAREYADGRWIGVIGFCNRQIHLGILEDAAEAAEAYDYAAWLLFDEFSWSNQDYEKSPGETLSADVREDILRRLYHVVKTIEWKDEAVLKLAMDNIIRESKRYNFDLEYTEPISRTRDGRGLSGYKGVHFYPKSGRWIAKLRINGKTVGGGTFDTPEEAASAYDFGMELLIGEKAWLNRDHRSSVQEPGIEIRKYVLSRLTEVFQSDSGWKDKDRLNEYRDIVDKAVQQLREAERLLLIPA